MDRLTTTRQIFTTIKLQLCVSAFFTTSSGMKSTQLYCEDYESICEDYASLRLSMYCIAALLLCLLLIMSHSLLWRHIVLLTVGVYSSNHRVLYIIGISMTRRFQKSVGPSVRLCVCNANKKSLLLIIDSRKIIRISDERVWHPLQENEAIFSAKYFSKILD